MMAAVDPADALRRGAAEAAMSDVRSGMKLGLGTGRTAEHFVRLLGERVKAGLDIVTVATSERTATLAASVGVRVATLDAEPVLDLAIDGADEIDAKLRLIKGGGGALLREKIVANAAKRFLVIVDEAKYVPTLGAFPLPVEVMPFGFAATVKAIERVLGHLGLVGPVVLRMAGAGPFVTDNGNRIVDLRLGRIPDPDALGLALQAIPGVMEHGLFIGMASAAIIAGSGGLRRLSRDQSSF
jgi:ribose 5-phosphate isomerase A